MTEVEIAELNKTVALGALKYFLLKVEPQKRMLFDPNESIDLRGHTGPFIQYSYARTESIKKKAAVLQLKPNPSSEIDLLPAEKNILRTLFKYPQVLKESAHTYNPGLIANYAFELAKEYNQFYYELPIIDPVNEAVSVFRLGLSEKVGTALKKSMKLLGIEVPQRM